VNQSDVQIKIQYESNLDTNVYTDVEKVAVSTIGDKVDNNHVHLGALVMSPTGAIVDNTFRFDWDGNDMVLERYNGSIWVELGRWSPV